MKNHLKLLCFCLKQSSKMLTLPIFKCWEYLNFFEIGCHLKVDKGMWELFYFSHAISGK